MSTAGSKKKVVADAKSWAADAISAAGGARAGSVVTELAQDGLAVWSKVLFPTPQLEEWKYTNTEAIAKGEFRLAPAPASGISSALLESSEIAELNAARIVFVDGHYVPALSAQEMPKGVSIKRLSELSTSAAGTLGLHRSEPFAALATALLTDGVEITVERGAVVSTPLHLINVVTAAARGCVVTPRVCLVAHESSQVTVVESYRASEEFQYLTLPVCEVIAAANAVVDIYRIQSDSRSAFHVSATAVEQQASSTVSTHIFSFGSSLARNNVTVALKGSGSNAVLNGLSVLSGSQHVDNSTEIHHIEPSAESREHFKGIYSETSRGVFSGTITVDKIAQKTNAFQSNQALLLSPTASIETRPQLKIWADDVKCTHGATVGQLDADALFYLRSRGLSPADAKNFLIHAFASEVLTTVRSGAVRSYVEQILSDKLGGEAGW
jgi:Fe-S cluster assembly protein SufD